MRDKQKSIIQRDAKDVWNNTPIKYRILVGIVWIAVIVIIFWLVFGKFSTIGAQSSDPTFDQWYTRNVNVTSGTQVYIYQSDIDTNIYVQSQTFPAGTFIDERPASTEEEFNYQFQRTERINETASSFALASLVDDPEQGEAWQTWVDNRTLELASCEQEATDALTLGNWTSQGTGVQNAIIASLLRCQAENSKVLRKTINNLLQVLIVEGIVTLQ